MEIISDSIEEKYPGIRKRASDLLNRKFVSKEHKTAIFCAHVLGHKVFPRDPQDSRRLSTNPTCSNDLEQINQWWNQFPSEKMDIENE